MKQNQFQDLINRIDELISSVEITNRDKEKLKKAKTYLLSSNEPDWEKGFKIATQVLTRASTILELLEKIWDWLSNIF